MNKSIFSPIMLRGIIPAALAFLLACPSGIFAQSAAEQHLVSPQALQQQAQSVSQAREQNIRTVTEFLNTPTADRAMRDAHFDPIQVRTAIPTLSDQELSDLASRASNAQQQFSAGSLSQSMLTLIIVLVAVIIIVAIVH
jgi:hypothetical protein